MTKKVTVLGSTGSIGTQSLSFSQKNLSRVSYYSSLFNFQDAVSLHSFVSCNFYIISHFLSFVNPFSEVFSKKFFDFRFFRVS